MIGARLYHAVGYHTPCERIVTVRPSLFSIEPGLASVNNLGVKTPITPETVAQPLSVGLRDGDGIRVSLSEFVEGEPLGPFTYDGLRTTPTTSSATGIAVALVADRPDAERLAAASAFHRPRPQRLRTDHSGVLRQLAEAEATPPSPPTDPRHTTTDRSPAPLPRTPPP